jgi:tRNA1Val (adenine37-N6)-methyltransferase
MPSALLLETRRAALETSFGERVTLDGLPGVFQFFQRRKGYRYSVDDLLTAYFAFKHAPERVTHMLDLGIGIGCVGLALASNFKDAQLTGIEAQDISVQLLRENVWANSFEARVRIIHDDLRNFSRHQWPEYFQLITASPPYFDIRNGLLPNDAQAAHCRFELRGDICDYAQCAAALLQDDGVFVFCFPTNQMTRAETALQTAGLFLNHIQQVIPKEHRPSLFSLFSASRQPHKKMAHEALIVRDVNGLHTAQMQKVYTRFSNSSG